MEDNFKWFVNGKGFMRYTEALEHSNRLLLDTLVFYGIYSKEEIQELNNKPINHELECGK